MINWSHVEKDNYDFNVVVPLSYKRTARVPLIDSINAHIQYIVDTYPAPYYLMLSGGVDSQAMLYSWIHSGKDFIPVSFNYNNGLNEFDLVNLEKFAKQQNVDIDFRDFDAIDFFNTTYQKYANDYRCGSPHICCYMRLSEEIDRGTVIFSGDPLWTISQFVDKNNWGLYKYAKYTKRNIIPYFFIETDTLANAALNSCVARRTDTTKANMYQLNGFPVICQNDEPSFPNGAYTGFEAMKDFYDANYAHLVTDTDRKLRLSNQHSNRVFDLLLRNKFEYAFRKDIYNVSFIEENNEYFKRKND